MERPATQLLFHKILKITKNIPPILKVLQYAYMCGLGTPIIATTDDGYVNRNTGKQHIYL